VSAKKNPEVSGKQNYNPTGYNSYSGNDDTADQNFYPLSDVWYLSYL
jgi:hypothetical protein